MKTLTVFTLALALSLSSCGTGSSTENATENTDSTSVVKVDSTVNATPSAADTATVTTVK